MARGIEKGIIFYDDADREHLLERLAVLVERGWLAIHAWALMPNHFHLLVQTGVAPLHRAMQSLLTAFAVSFNRRHGRVGHVFQNRYKSILCEDEAYFFDLVRYIHLNPLKHGLVRDLYELERYAYTGHATLLGFVDRPWQATHRVLQHFSAGARVPMEGYRDFVALGAIQGMAQELAGIVLVRGKEGSEIRDKPKRPRENFGTDERVLGSEEFVEGLKLEMGGPESRRGVEPLSLDAIIERICEATGISREALGGPGRSAAIVRAREGLSYLWIHRLGGSGRFLAMEIGLAPVSVYAAAKRGRRSADQWHDLLQERWPAGKLPTN